jgi:hypothetical protein
MLPEFKARELLAEKGMVLTERNKNCLFMHNSNESMKHWITKCIVFKILRERERIVGTEIEVDGGIVDVIDVNNFIGYEIESALNKERVKEKIKQFECLKDVFFIDISRLPNDIRGIEEYLKRKIV